MSVHRNDLGTGIFSFEELLKSSTGKYPSRMSFESGLQVEPYNNFQNNQNREVIVRIFVPPPPLILVCIGFNVNRPSKEK